MTSFGHLQLTLERIQAIRSRFEPARAEAQPADASFEQFLNEAQTNAVDRNQVTGLIQNAARQQQLDPALIEAVVQTESGFNPNAVSPAGAQGLMQLMPGTARELGVSDPMDPEQNINGGARYLKQMISRFKSVPLGVAAYNAGPRAVQKHGGVPPYAETTRYVEKVLKRYEANKALDVGGLYE